MTVAWAWHVSKHVGSSLKMRSKFTAAAVRESSVAKRLASAPPDSPLGELLAEWPQTSGTLLWPYQCADWDAKTRFERIEGHLEALQQVPGLKLGPHDKLRLLNLEHYSSGCSLILDRPIWLAREGHLTLSLFKHNFRAFTVSFSLSGWPDMELFIGGLQGRQSEGILDLYRDLTKDFCGIRPRDFLLEMLRVFAAKIGVQHIHAVADEHKISRHRYFGEKAAPGLFYDEVWVERGGERVAETHFELPVVSSRRPLDEVAAKRRSMYRKRYEMLDTIEAAMSSDLTTAERVQFDAR